MRINFYKYLSNQVKKV